MTSFEAAYSPAQFGFGELFDLVGDAVVVVDAESNTIRLWNQAAARLFGYDRSEAIGMSVTALIPEELRQGHIDGIARFAREGTILLTPPGGTVEVPAVCRNGARLWIELTLTALQGEQAPMALALIRDVTDRRQAQDGLARANQALRDFVAVAAHDLRSPAATALSAIELLRDVLAEASIPEEATDLIEVAERRVRSLLAFVADLLDTASLDSGHVTVQPEVISLAKVLAVVAAEYGDLGVDIPPGLAVMADTRHVQRILTNLVANAYRHGARPVTVTARPAHAMGSVDIAVCDAGIAITADASARLFDAYVTGAKSAGTGLGLSIARGLARANGGDLTYEPQGAPVPTSRFVLRLPLPA